jgi:hypothetical protein
VEKTKQLCLAFLAAALLGLNATVPALAQDGGDDGGFDDGGFEDGGMDEPGDGDNDQDKDGDGQPDKDKDGDGGGHGHKGGHGHHGNHHHHHVHPYYGGWPAWGFGFGAFGYMPPYYPPPYGYAPAAGRFVPPAVYIERKDTAQPATESQANYWHYCRSAEGYYPYVKECPDGWEQVAPTPPQAGKDDQE